MIGSAFGQNDPRLQAMADELGIAVVSVDYGLSPEAQFPVPVNDCVAAALWLVREGPRHLGTKVFVAGGESAGGHLMVCTLLQLRELAGQCGNPELAPATAFRCVNLVYGWFDLGGTPSLLSFKRPLVMDGEDLLWAARHFCPDDAVRTKRAGPEAGGASPLFSNLDGMPPALFTVGTEDALRDDTLFMAARWAAHGIEAELEVYPGAAHGIGHFGPHQYSPQASEINGHVCSFLRRWIGDGANGK